MEVKKQQLDLNMEQQTGSKLGKECVKAVYCHLAYLTYMQRTLCEIPAWNQSQAGIKIAGRNINNLRCADGRYRPKGRINDGALKSLLTRVKEKGETACLKLSI